MNECAVVVRNRVDSYEKLLSDGFADEVFSLVRKTVSPGQTVVVKPNLVAEHRWGHPNETVQIVTHAAVVERIVREAVCALHGCGRVVIADAPQTDSDYEAIARLLDLDGIVQRCSANTTVAVEHFDLREEKWITREGVTVGKKQLAGDPLGYCEIDLGSESLFEGKANKTYYGADYDQAETARYHNDRNNIYVMSNTVLACDVFINVPKLKTHKLGGLTCSLKNAVGTCVVKNSLPHHTTGVPDEGGDQFFSATKKSHVEKALKGMAATLLKHKNPLISYPIGLVKKGAGKVLGSQGSQTIRNGSWYGNDTIWRTTLDLNRILLYSDRYGIMRDGLQRAYLTIVDAVIAAEGDGPLDADAKDCGVLMAGTNPVAVDFAAARLMGFDWRCVPTISHAFDSMRWPLASFTSDDVCIAGACSKWSGRVVDVEPASTLAFKPHFGWTGHVELKRLG